MCAPYKLGEPIPQSPLMLTIHITADSVLYMCPCLCRFFISLRRCDPTATRAVSLWSLATLYFSRNTLLKRKPGKSCLLSYNLCLPKLGSVTLVTLSNCALGLARVINTYLIPSCVLLLYSTYLRLSLGTPITYLLPYSVCAVKSSLRFIPISCVLANWCFSCHASALFLYCKVFQNLFRTLCRQVLSC